MFLGTIWGVGGFSSVYRVLHFLDTYLSRTNCPPRRTHNSAVLRASGPKATLAKTGETCDNLQQ